MLLPFTVLLHFPLFIYPFPAFPYNTSYIHCYMWLTPSKPAVSVGKYFFRFVDAETAEILSSKMMHHLSYSLKVSPMKSQYFSWKFFCFLLICDMFIGLYLKVFWRLTSGFVGVGHICYPQYVTRSSRMSCSYISGILISRYI